jgi:hypothetical protein
VTVDSAGGIGLVEGGARKPSRLWSRIIQTACCASARVLDTRLFDLDIERQLNGQIIRTAKGLLSGAFGAAASSARRRLRAGAQAP